MTADDEKMRKQRKRYYRDLRAIWPALKAKAACPRIEEQDKDGGDQPKRHAVIGVIHERSMLAAHLRKAEKLA